MSNVDRPSRSSGGIQPPPARVGLPYLWAVAAVGAGVAARSMIGPWVGDALPFVTLYPAVFVAAVLGGFRPGVLATALSAVAALHLYIEPVNSLALTDAVARFAVALFAGSGLATAWLGEARLRAERQVRSALERAQHAAIHAEGEAVRAEEEAARAEEEQLLAQEQTARADAQAARAADALARLERTLASINEGFMVLDPNFVITYMNQQAAVLGGGTQPQDFVGKTHWEAFPESYHTTFGRAYRLAMAEQRVVRVAGEYAPLQRSFQVTVYPGGDNITVVVQDITELMATQKELQVNEERLLLAQTGAGLGLWEYDARSGAMQSGVGLAALYGLSADAPPLSYDDWLNTVVYPEDRESVRRAVQDALAGRRRLDREFRVTWPLGEVHWLAGRGRVVRDEAGTPLRMLGVVFDVTARREAEDRLRQAERMEVVGQLAGGVAHEANNQMTVVLGAADFVLRRSDLPDIVREDVQHIRAAAERTANITTQLLAFSRRQVLQPRSLEVDEALEGIAGVVRRALGPLSTLVLHLRAEHARVSADPGQFAQVVLNLALNAADAMPLGGTLSIGTQTTELTEAYAKAHPGVTIVPGAYVLCAVSDTGHGMSPTTRRHVFEPFFTTKPVGKGTGLGLATVYGIVKQSGGYIWVYSEPGHGTTFKLYLPLEPGPIALSTGLVAPVHGAGETVLVVDDDAPVRDVTARALQDHGFVAIEAAAGGEALDIVVRTDGALRLLVTYVLMPGMNGAELARRVRKIRPELPVLFVSGYTDEEVVRRGLVEAGQPFLQKPFTPEALARRVSDLLGRPAS